MICSRESDLLTYLLTESALIFWDQKNFNPSSVSHVTQEFVCEQTVIFFGFCLFYSVF